MRAVRVCLMLLLPPTAAWAQQGVAPSLQDGPLASHADGPLTPQADPDGVYRLGPGVELPRLVDAVAAVYPAEAAAEEHPHVCLLSAVVWAGGAVRKLEVVRSAGEAYDRAAIDAVNQSKFEPGMVDGKPVPVRVTIRVPFVQQRPALPRVVSHMPGMDSEGITYPKPIFQKEAEYSEKARKKRISGVVRISLVVTAEGLPSDIKVVQGIGYGLDEKAVEAVSQYRFKPAMRGDTPVAVAIQIQVQFKIF